MVKTCKTSMQKMEGSRYIGLNKVQVLGKLGQLNERLGKIGSSSERIVN